MYKVNLNNSHHENYSKSNKNGETFRSAYRGKFTVGLCVYVVFSFTNSVYLVCCICIKQNVVTTVPRTVFGTYYVHQN